MQVEGHEGILMGDFVLITLGDNGYGMTREALTNLFEPFLHHQGSRLGLATVYGIVKQNHGFITVDSEPEKGTTFRIYLPRQTGRTETEKRKRKHETAPNARRNEIILLVEAEPSILLMTMLRKLGYRNEK